jgi:hypothetical protein
VEVIPNIQRTVRVATIWFASPFIMTEAQVSVSAASSWLGRNPTGGDVRISSGHSKNHFAAVGRAPTGHS